MVLLKNENMTEQLKKELEKRKRKHWVILDFLLWVFISISIFYILLGNTLNVYAMASGFITVVALYTRKTGVSNFFLFVIITTIYSLLWVFAIQLGLNAYIILINLMVGLILAFSIGVIYEFKEFKNGFEKKGDIDEIPN